MNIGVSEKIFFAYARKNTDFLNFIQPRYFTNDDVRHCFMLTKQHFADLREVPSKEQIAELAKIKDIKNLTREKLDLIYDVVIGPTGYTEAWCKDNVEMWVKFNIVQSKVEDASMYLGTTSVNIENINDVVYTVEEIFGRDKNFTLEHDESLDFFDPTAHVISDEERVSSGYTFIDTITDGGFSTKTLVVFMGPPKIGKSLTLGNVAAKLTLQGHNTAVITLELSDKKYSRRIGSNLMTIPMSGYDDALADPVTFKKKLNAVCNTLDMSKPMGRLRVKEFPTSALGVPELESWLLKEEQRLGIKFKFVVIDYLNIMKNFRNPNSENLYLKIKTIAEDLRAMSSRNNWCVISATQTNKDNYRQSDIFIENTSESSGLIHTVDLLIGIIQDDIMYRDNIYYWKNLANRDGGLKNAKKQLDVNYNYMRVEENLHSPIIED